MTMPDLNGIYVLVLEDDFYQATDLEFVLKRCGATVAGPFRDANDALAAIQPRVPDIALIDVNLGSGPSFELPGHLEAHRIPFAFITGYDDAAIPVRFAAVPRIEKPAADQTILDTAIALLARRVPKRCL